MIIVSLGTLVGFLLALTGAGGGILAVPLLIFGANLTVAQAAPIALLAVGISASLGAGIGFHGGVVRYKAGILMGVTGLVFAPVGIWLSHQLNNTLMTIIFSVVLLIVSYRTFNKGKSDSNSADTEFSSKVACVRNNTSGKFIWTSSCARSLSLSGMVTGILSGLLGVGGGFVLVPALRKYTDLTMKSVVPTSLFVISLVSLFTVASSAVFGNLKWDVGAPFAAGALTGMAVGYFVSKKLNGVHMQKAFALFSGVIALFMFTKGIYGLM